MNIVDLSIKRPIMISMALIASFLFGLFAYFTLPVTLLPDVKTPYVTVQTVYAGAGPEVVENQITRSVENAVSAIGGLKRIVSYSMDSVSYVSLEFDFTKDEDIALQEVREKVDAVSGEFPSDSEKPVITKENIASMTPVMTMILEGDIKPSELYTLAKENISNQFSQVSGVGSVDISGGVKREIQVNFDRTTVYERKVPVTTVAEIIAAANTDVPGGNITYKNRDIPVQFKGTFSNLDELQNLDIATETGVLKLHQITEVEDTSKTARERTILLDKTKGTRNENAVLLQIIKNPSGNTVEIVNGIKKLIPQIEDENGGAVHLEVVSEDATYVNDTVKDTISNVIMGILLTGIVLIIFLHDWKSTLIVAIAMPYSIVSTFFVMKIMGIGVNLLSLTGLSAATGTLVANSIVVLENIFKYKSAGMKNAEAASRGTTEVIGAVFASTLTNVAVFLPIASINNMVGSILASFAYTTVISTVFSIVVSFTLTPMMASRMLPETSSDKKEKKQNIFTKFADGFEAAMNRLKNGYEKTLGFVLEKKSRSVIVVLIVIVMLVLCGTQAGKIGFELLPTTDGGKLLVKIELPQGTDLEATARMFKEVEDRISSHKEVQKIQTVIGNAGGTEVDVSLGQMYVYLCPKDKRKKSTMELAPEYAAELSDIAGADIKVSSVSEISFGDGGFGLSLDLKGDDMKVLQKCAEEMKERLGKIEGLANISLSSKSGKQELVFVPDRKQISLDGLTVQEIAILLRASVDGIEISKYRENNVEYDIRVSMDKDSIKDLDDIKNIPVTSGAGVYPLSRYARLSFENSTNMITRVNKKRTIQITGDVLPGYSIGLLQNKAMEELSKMELPKGCSLANGDSSELMDETVGGLVTAFAIAIVIIYMLLAATLENLADPLYILATVPLSLIGVVVIVRLTGAVLNIVAMLGIIMLVGIVVNNAILILDMFKSLKKSGMKMKDAMVKASGEKLKAILMSNIAIILGQLPMALGIGASGAEMRQPMGLVIVGGIISSTLMTLYVIPALERIFSKKEA